jgi:hypothetical protein
MTPDLDTVPERQRRPGGVVGLGGFVEFVEEGAELVEAFGVELLGPGVFHFGDCFADGKCTRLRPGMSPEPELDRGE